MGKVVCARAYNYILVLYTLIHLRVTTKNKYNNFIILTRPVDHTLGPLTPLTTYKLIKKAVDYTYT